LYIGEEEKTKALMRESKWDEKRNQLAFEYRNLGVDGPRSFDVVGKEEGVTRLLQGNGRYHVGHLIDARRMTSRERWQKRFDSLQCYRKADGWYVWELLSWGNTDWSCFWQKILYYCDDLNYNCSPRMDGGHLGHLLR
jgi:hypothetical protein